MWGCGWQRRAAAFAFLAALSLGTGVTAARDWFPCLETRLDPASGIAAVRFGASVDLHRDLLIVGAPGHSAPGYARIYRRSNGAWTPEAVLTTGQSALGEAFGTSVAIDGTTAVVGAPGRGAGGAVHVFEQSTAGWNEVAILSRPEEDLDREAEFGASIDIEGKILLVGSPGRHGSTGAVYAFRRDGTWKFGGRLIGPELAPGDRYGDSVSLSLPRAIVGAPFHDADGMDAGSAWIFRRHGKSVVLETRLTDQSTRPGDRFGTSVHLRENLAMVGAPFNDDAGFGTGAAYVFSPTGASNGSWISQGSLFPFDAFAGENFGWAVAVSPYAALSGALRGDGTRIDTGSAYVFAASDAITWRPVSELFGQPGEFLDEYGSAVALGTRWAVAGSPNESGARGAVYIYDLFSSCPPAP